MSSTDFPSTPQQILARLEAGNTRYMADKLERSHQNHDRRAALNASQHPWCIVLSCADSRVVPELVFDTGLGELFVIRVAGNVANTETIASIEYAVANIKESLVIVVLGHESCGAVTAALREGDNGYNLNMLLSHILPAKMAAGAGSSVNDVVKTNAKMVADELVRRSPIIADALESKGLSIKPAYYELESGKVTFL